MEKNIVIIWSLAVAFLFLGGLKFFSRLFRPSRKKETTKPVLTEQRGDSLSFQKLVLITVVFFQATIFLIPSIAIFKSMIAKGEAFKAVSVLSIYILLITIGLFFLWIKGDLLLVKESEK